MGQWLTEGFSEGPPLGMPDKVGSLDGCELGWEDGIDVGQSETDGFCVGYPLGISEGCTLGWLLGLAEGSSDGREDVEGFNEGSNDGREDVDGLSDG